MYTNPNIRKGWLTSAANECRRLSYKVSVDTPKVQTPSNSFERKIYQLNDYEMSHTASSTAQMAKKDKNQITIRSGW